MPCTVDVIISNINTVVRLGRAARNINSISLRPSQKGAKPLKPYLLAWRHHSLGSPHKTMVLYISSFSLTLLFIQSPHASRVLNYKEKKSPRRNMNGRDTPKRRYYWMALAKTPTLTFKSSAECVASRTVPFCGFHTSCTSPDERSRPNRKEEPGGGGGTLHESFFHHCWAEYFRRVRMYTARCCHAKYNISPLHQSLQDRDGSFKYMFSWGSCSFNYITSEGSPKTKRKLMRGKIPRIDPLLRQN